MILREASNVDRKGEVDGKVLKKKLGAEGDKRVSARGMENRGARNCLASNVPTKEAPRNVPCDHLDWSKCHVQTPNMPI